LQVTARPRCRNDVRIDPLTGAGERPVHTGRGRRYESETIDQRECAVRAEREFDKDAIGIRIARDELVLDVSAEISGTTNISVML
jgi:hypothetical protein